MNAMQIARELSKESFWAKQPRKVLILAARFYAGVDSLNQLRLAQFPLPCLDNYTMPPMLTDDQIRMIVDLR